MMLEGWDVEPFHWDGLNDALNFRESFWLAPRGAGKSTAVAVFVPAWLALIDPAFMAQEIRELNGGYGLFPNSPRMVGPWNIRIALSSNSEQKAIGLHFQVQQILIGQKVQSIFGLQAGRRWKETVSEVKARKAGREQLAIDYTMQVLQPQGKLLPLDLLEYESGELREGTFTVLGLGSTVAGGHYDAGVFDDWVTEENARTPVQRDKLQSFYATTVRGTLEPWSKQIGAGTRYHPADWYQTIRQWVEKGLWGTLRRTRALYMAADPEGPVDFSQVDQLRSYWPENYPVDELLKIREQIGAVAFATQYQNETDLMLGDFFDPKHLEVFTHWDQLPPQDRLKAKTVITCDPAIKGGKKNDYTAFVVTSYIAPNFYVRKVLRGQWTEEEFLQHWSMLCAEYRPERVGIEVIQGLEWVLPKLRPRCGIGAYFKALYPQSYRGKDKEGRASAARTFMEQGRIFFDTPTPQNGVGRLIDECMAFPNAENIPGMDDCVDAFAWGILFMMQSRTQLRKVGR
jgi:phage terminase large subunit-like protein